MTLIETLTECAELHTARCNAVGEKNPDLCQKHCLYATALAEAIDIISKALQKKPKKAPKEKKAVHIPHRQEVHLYASELGMPAKEADKFFDYFESNGWRVGGRSPMKDWKAALRNWRRNWEERNPMAARASKTPGKASTDTDPAGWEDFLGEHKYPAQSYRNARQYLRDDFQAWLSR